MTGGPKNESEVLQDFYRNIKKQLEAIEERLINQQKIGINDKALQALHHEVTETMLRIVDKMNSLLPTINS